MLGVRAAAGSLFDISADEEKPGANPVVVISHRLWRNRFHGGPPGAGKTTRVNGRILTITGAAGPAFRGRQSALRMDLWMPVPGRCGGGHGRGGATIVPTWKSRQGAQELVLKPLPATSGYCGFLCPKAATSPRTAASVPHAC